MSTPSSFPSAAKAVTEQRQAVITTEADQAIFGIMKKYGFASFALVVLLPVIYGLLYSHFSHSKLFSLHGPIAWLAAVVWMFPWYIGQSKASVLRIDYGRKFVAEKRWKEAAAALNVFAEWGQRSFDRTGEGHYLLSVAYDKLGRKEKAEEMRKFIRKHRAGTEWATKAGGASAQHPVHGHKALSNEGETAAATAARKAKAAPARRRRRF